MDLVGEACGHGYAYEKTPEGLGPRSVHKPSEARLEDWTEGVEKG